MQQYVKHVLLAVAIATTAILAVCVIGYLIQGVLLIFAGVLFGVFLSQIALRTAGLLNIRYGTALAIAVCALTLIAGGTMYFMGSRISEQLELFVDRLDDASAAFAQTFENQPWLKRISQFTPRGGTTFPTRLFSTAGSAVSALVFAVGSIVFVVFIGFYLALQAERCRDAVVQLAPPKLRVRAREVLQKSAHTLWHWLLGRLLGMAVIGVGSTIGLWALGIPLPVTLGTIAGLLNFVPNFGPLIAAVPPVLFAFQQGPHLALYVAGFYLTLQFLESYLLTPLINQYEVRLLPAFVLSAQLLFGMLAGLLGLVLATPLTAVIALMVRELYIDGFLESHENRARD